MSGNKNRSARNISDEAEVAAATEVAAAGDQLAGVEVAASAATGLKVFEVEIPNCLLGKRTFVATDEADAYQQYRKLGGINSHERPQIVAELPPGCRGYAAAVAAHEAALAKAQE